MAHLELGLTTDLTLPEKRIFMETRAAQIFDNIDGMHKVLDVKVPGAACEIPVRVYQASADASSQLLVYFHGGGFVMGSIKSHDAVCRRLAKYSQALVASVEYRLAPEHPYPAGPNDCYAAAQWVHEHATELGVRPGSFTFGVAGDSAGANLAACLTLHARSTAFPRVDFQILICPVLQCIPEPLSGSHLEFKDGPVLTVAAGIMALNIYLGDINKHHKDPAVFPLEAEDLSGLPPALIINAKIDILRDDGILYAQRLKEAGVEADMHEFATEHVMMLFAPKEYPDIGRQSFEAIANFMKAQSSALQGS